MLGSVHDLPPDVDLDRELVKRGGLRQYVELAWSQVEKTPFVPGWHIDEISAHLEAVTRGEIRTLLVNVPPGMTKSLQTCVFWPTWEWAEVEPTSKWLNLSYSSGLSRRDAIRARNLMCTPWFKARWPGLYIPHQNTHSATDFQNNKGGRRISSTLKGGVTGHHANRIIIDDPTKPMDASGRRAIVGTELDMVIDLYDHTISTRAAEIKTLSIVVIMQRLHERDLSGHMKENESDMVHLRLPMEYEPKFHCSTKIGGDRRAKDGELLCEERFPRKEVDKLKRKLGSVGTASQLQQRPSPIGGAIFKQEWIQYWGHPASPYPELPDRVRMIQSWDFAFKGAPTGRSRRSYVAGQCWASKGSDFFLIAQERGQWEFVESCHAVLRMTKAYPKAVRKLFEDAANGPAIKSALGKRVTGIKLIPTGGGSEARAQAVSPLFEAGNVWLPHPSIAPWVTDLVAELTGFPMAAHDDQVDACTHALVNLTAGAANAYRTAMAKVRR